MKKISLLALCAAFLAVSGAGASEMGSEEIRFVQAAEEISASAMDDDEKIERLTEIGARVREIRSRRLLSEKPVRTSIAEAVPANPRPLSTFVRNQTRQALDPAPTEEDDEPEPTALVRFGISILRFVGWTVVVGISAAVLLFVGIVVMALFQQIGENLKRPAPRARASPGNSVNRDGIVPARFR